MPFSIDIALRWSAVFSQSSLSVWNPRKNTHAFENLTHMQRELSEL